MDIELDNLINRLRAAVDAGKREDAACAATELSFVAAHAARASIGVWTAKRWKSAQGLLERTRQLLKGTPLESRINRQIGRLPAARPD